ncbi:MAG: nitroreductase [Candidatus Azotimanducaceae bacterium]|jgi:nitroreductase
MEPNALDMLVHERRSIRGYLKKPVTQALLAEIITVAKGAPVIDEPWLSRRISSPSS